MYTFISSGKTITQIRLDTDYTISIRTESIIRLQRHYNDDTEYTTITTQDGVSFDILGWLDYKVIIPINEVTSYITFLVKV